MEKGGLNNRKIKNGLKKIAKNKAEENPANWATNIPFYLRLSVKEKIFFFKYLAAMTESGIPLEKSLQTIHEQSKSTTMHRVLHLMLTDVAAGEFISSSMKKIPRVFDPMLTSLVAVGENSGTLTEELKRIAEHLEKSMDLRNKVIAAMLYPILIVFGTIGVTIYMLFVLIPQLLPMFSSLNVELPITTRMIIYLSQFLRDHGVTLLIVVGITACSLPLLLRNEKIRFAFEKFCLRLPFIGSLILKIQIAQITRIIGTLLKSGLTIVEAFGITAGAMQNRVYRKALTEIAAKLQEGSSVSQFLLEHPRLFPSFTTQMISVGEQTGRLDDMCIFAANFNDREVDDMTKVMTSTMEPLLMIIMGGVVGFIAIAVITPIYQLTQGLHG